MGQGTRSDGEHPLLPFGSGFENTPPAVTLPQNLGSVTQRTAKLTSPESTFSKKCTGGIHVAIPFNNRAGALYSKNALPASQSTCLSLD